MESGSKPYIYLFRIKNTEFYKVGLTKRDPVKRIKTLQTGNPQTIELCKHYQTDLASKIERVIHRIWKHKKFIPEDFDNLNGEWFKLELDSVIQFDYICFKIEHAIQTLHSSSTDR